jgi:type III secretion system YscD/HrpQ family protein
VNAKTTAKEEYQQDCRWDKEFRVYYNFSDSSQPIPTPANQCHQLMIFTGLHAGASLKLADGTFSLGRSYECDIVLKDPGIEPIHLSLICDARTISVRPEMGKVYLDGRFIERETVLPEPPVVVTIAAINLGLAIEGVIWSPLDFPRIEDDGGNVSGSHQEEQISKDHASAEKPANPTATHNSKASLNRLRKVGALSKYLAAMFILLFILSAEFFFHIKSPDNAALIKDIEKQFADRSLPKPDIQIDAEGFLDIAAYVPTVSQKMEITAFLQDLPVTVRPHMYIDSEVERGLQDYILKMAFALEAVYQGNGRASVKGFVENQQQTDVIKNLLKSNVMGLHTVDLDVLQLDQIRPELDAALKDAALSDKIEISPQPGHLLAKGTLDTKEQARWQQAKKTMLERLGRPLNIVDQIDNREFVPGKVDLPIVGVTMEPYPFITLEDGKVYFKGATMKNGTVIKDIGPERIVVEIDGQEYYYNF